MTQTNQRLEITGAREAFRDLARVTERIEDDSRDVTEKFGPRVVSLVASEVPVVTGAMRGALESVVVEGASVVGYDTDAAPHAGWIEFGGSHGRPYVPGGRFLYPTGTNEADAYGNALEDAAKRTVKGYPWSKSK